MVDANSDGASEGEVRSVSRHGPGSQLFDSDDNTGHRVVEVLVACRLLDAAEALEEVLSVVTPLAKVKNIAIDNQVPAGMSIRVDRTRFKQVLYNLLSNAVKFTPENGRVWIADASRQDAAGFCVGDTGIGIPESELEAVFDEFHQAGRPAGSATQGPGTGLGLAITRRLVELHGGTIRAESTAGEGSRFILSLGPHSLEPNDVDAI